MVRMRKTEDTFNSSGVASLMKSSYMKRSLIGSSGAMLNSNYCV